ncbi:MAG: hypothetical protein Q8P79_02860 [Nanoarchaeota archaeon]|nr:hypothetical protein [Nanoarchaeota archaeon]
MAKEEIVEGLRQAVSKGETMERAMTSFYNSGYPKEDIEEAARALQLPQFQQPAMIRQPAMQNFQPAAQASTQSYQGVVQRVSEYGKPPSKRGRVITIILFILLLLLFGILAAVMIFKDELSGFFNNLFWRALL